MNKVNNIWVSDKSFPEYILGDNFYLSLHNTSDEHIDNMVKLEENNWDDFKDYLFRYFFDKQSAKQNIIKRNELMKQGLLVDYAINILSGKTIGGISFVNIDYKTLGCSYYLDKPYRHQGFISKSLKLTEKEMAKLGFEKIVLEINENNNASKNVALKNNYIYKDSIGLMGDFIKNITNQR